MSKRTTDQKRIDPAFIPRFIAVALCLVFCLVTLGCPGSDSGEDAGTGRGGTTADGDAGSAAAPDWVTLELDQHGFKVDMRGTPEIEPNRIVLGTMPGDPIYMVSFSSQDLQGPDVALNLELKAGNYPADYEKESDEFFEWNGHPAYRVSAKGTGDQGDIRSRRMTVYANGVLYNVGITGTKELVDRDAEHFYKSFELMEAAE